MNESTDTTERLLMRQEENSSSESQETISLNPQKWDQKNEVAITKTEKLLKKEEDLNCQILINKKTEDARMGRQQEEMKHDQIDEENGIERFSKKEEKKIKREYFCEALSSYGFQITLFLISSVLGYVFFFWLIRKWRQVKRKYGRSSILIDQILNSHEEFSTKYLSRFNILLNSVLFIGIWFRVVAILETGQAFRVCSLLAQIAKALILLHLIFKTDCKIVLNYFRPQKLDSDSLKRQLEVGIEKHFPIETEKQILKAELESESWIFKTYPPFFSRFWFYVSLAVQFVLSLFIDFAYFGPWGLKCCDWVQENAFSSFIQAPLIYLSTLALVKHQYILRCREALLKKLGRFSEEGVASLFKKPDSFAGKLYAWCDITRIYANFCCEDLSNADKQLKITMFYYLLRFALAWAENLWGKGSTGDLFCPDTHETKPAECANSVAHFYTFYNGLIAIQLLHLLSSFLAEKRIKKRLLDDVQLLDHYESFSKREENSNQASKEKSRDYSVAKEQLMQCMDKAPVLYPKKMIGGLVAMSVIVLPLIEKFITEDVKESKDLKDKIIAFSIIVAIVIYMIFLSLHKFKKGME